MAGCLASAVFADPPYNVRIGFWEFNPYLCQDLAACNDRTSLKSIGHSTTLLILTTLASLAGTRRFAPSCADGRFDLRPKQTKLGRDILRFLSLTKARPDLWWGIRLFWFCGFQSRSFGVLSVVFHNRCHPRENLSPPIFFQQRHRRVSPTCWPRQMQASEDFP